MDYDKKILFSVIAAIFAMIFTFFSVLGGMTETEKFELIGYFVAGMIIALISPFVKEKHIYKSAFVLYAVILASMVAQTIMFDSTSPLSFMSFDLYSAVLLPLTYLGSIKMLCKEDGQSLARSRWAIAMMLLPIILAVMQKKYTLAIISALTSYIVLFVAKKEKVLKISWTFLSLPAFAAIFLAVYVYKNSDGASLWLETVLSRGQNDPNGAGWMRCSLDGIFMNTPFYGETTFSVGEINASDLINSWGNHNIVFVLAENGWVFFVGLIMVYVVFYRTVFLMVSQTKQSKFARYLSLSLALSLLLQAVYSIFGLFLFDGAKIDMPFMSNDMVANMVNYISLDIICVLYMLSIDQRKEWMEDESEVYSSVSSVDESTFSELEDVDD